MAKQITNITMEWAGGDIHFVWGMGDDARIAGVESDGAVDEVAYIGNVHDETIHWEERYTEFEAALLRVIQEMEAYSVEIPDEIRYATPCTHTS